MGSNLIWYLLFFLILSLVIGYFVIQMTGYGQTIGQYILPENAFKWITGKSKEETAKEETPLQEETQPITEPIPEETQEAFRMRY